MHTNEWSFAGGYCKLKTARQKKRLQKQDSDKRLIQLQKQEDELYIQRRNLPMIPLDQPYQRGWKRSFVLREDVARSSAAAFYNNLLPKINVIDYATDKSFKRKIRRKRKKGYEIRPLYLREFYTWEWHHPQCKLTEAEKAHFSLKECRSKDGKTILLKYVFTEPWRFVPRVRPNIITHIKMVDEALEAAIRRLDNHIEHRHLRPAINRILFGCSYNYKHRAPESRSKNPLKNKPLYKILEAAEKEEI